LQELKPGYRPQPNFSACFGTIYATSSNKYAEMLSKKIQEADVKVWLINTGWTVELTEPVAE
jgi:phosphoenolpyruvate carboxykinase (ATP)